MIVELLKIITDKEFRRKIILSIVDDDKKIELIDSLHDKVGEVELVSSLKNSDKKIERLMKIKDRGVRLMIIQTMLEWLSNDEKIKLLAIAVDVCEQGLIVASLRDDDDKTIETPQKETDEKSLEDMSLEELEKISQGLDEDVAKKESELNIKKKQLEIAKKRARLQELEKESRELDAQLKVQPAKGPHK